MELNFSASLWTKSSGRQPASKLLTWGILWKVPRRRERQPRGDERAGGGRKKGELTTIIAMNFHFQPGNHKAWKLSPETRNLSASVTLIPWEQIITLSHKDKTFSSAPSRSLRLPKCRRACSQAIKARLGSQMKMCWYLCVSLECSVSFSF